MDNFRMIAKTFFGFEEILAKELMQLGAQKIEKGTRNVSFYGDLGFLYKANLSLRTAIRILVPIKDFVLQRPDDLYQNVKQIDWSTYLTPQMSFKIEVTEHQSVFKNTNYIGLLAKDAVVDQFRERFEARPNIDKDFPEVCIHVHIDRLSASISLDSSGASLHQRGYRSLTNIAPINEVLAAGMLLLSGWDLFDTIIDSLLKKTREFQYTITGIDKAPSAVNKALQNILNAKLEDYITVHQNDFFKTKKTINGPLHMVFNPPYGERLALDVQNFYASLGTTLKHGYPDTQAWLITSDLEALKQVGLRPSQKIKLYNGKLEAKFVNYQLYHGSKKASKNNTI